MTQKAPAPHEAAVVIGYRQLVDFIAQVFRWWGLPQIRARAAAEALCYGDLTGLKSHGLVNLTRLYLPLLAEGRVDPAAELEVMADRGAALLVDAHQALGLWAASEAMDMAVGRAFTYGIGLVSVRNASHFGCAGYHSARAVSHGMVGIVAANCGRQRIVRPPDGQVAMLGTNPLSVAAPAGALHPFVLDMATTAVPAGRVRQAADAGVTIPEGWLEDDDGNPVTDPAAFDRGTAHLVWLGGDVGRYKGYGLGLLVEVLAASVSGAGCGPSPEALAGKGSPSWRDDDIGFFILAIAPETLQPPGEVQRRAQTIFETLLACPPVPDGPPVRYPGWNEGERARHHRRHGVPLSGPLFRGLCRLADSLDLPPPLPVGLR